MRKTLPISFLGFLFFFVGTFYAENVRAQRTCATPLAVEQALKRKPKLIQKYEQLKQLNQPSSQADLSIRRGAPTVRIPVVVHIVLPNPDIVTDEQILSQIKVLNDDYQWYNQDNSDVPPVWKSIIGDMKIEFCLAAQTPEGLPTNGIERKETSHSAYSPNYAVAEVKHTATGGVDAWNTDDYLNIWVCDISQNILGVGTPPEIYPPDEQGVVIKYDAFGTVGPFLLPDFNKGRSCTHEVGHYFNLLHVWGDTEGNCAVNDLVEDTPPQSKPIYGDPDFPYLTDPCSPQFPGAMFNNFMGYANDRSMNMFTEGQVDRALATFFTYRSSLLQSKGCEPVLLEEYDAGISTILQPNGKICFADILPKIVLKNFGSKDLNSVKINYQVDDGSVKTMDWEGQLKTFDSSTIELNSLDILEGNHQLSVFSSSPNHQSDAKLSNDTAKINFHLDPIEDAPFLEDFEGGIFPPQGWTIHNPDHRFTWEEASVSSSTGDHSAVMRNLAYQVNGAIDELISPVFDLQNTDSAFLYFDVAAAVQSAPDGNNKLWDTLEVLISYDCGEAGISLYKKAGRDLITASEPTSINFVPSAKQWRQDSIDLTDYFKKGNFRLIFRNISNFENNIYLDNIRIKKKKVNPHLKEQGYLVVPNPTTGNIYVEFLEKDVDLRAISIYSMSGRLIDRKSASSLNKANRITFDLGRESNGVYLVKISYSDHEVVEKVIKIH